MLGSVGGVGAGVGLLLLYFLRNPSLAVLSDCSAHRSWLRSQPFCVAWVFASTDIWMNCSSITAAVSQYPPHSIVTGLLLAFLMRHAGGLPLGLHLFTCPGFFLINALRSFGPFVAAGVQMD